VILEWPCSNLDFAFLRDLCESFASFAVKGFRSTKLGHDPGSGQLAATIQSDYADLLA
jgi:hypothetical protein